MNNTRLFIRFSLKTVLLFIIMFALSFSNRTWICNYPGGIPMASAQTKRIRAPELTGGTAWLNVSRPLTLADLKGKVVLLDFWTYCCINCMHIIPDLKKLETKYSRELVIIGVHSAKFQNEREAENIRQAILRYGIEHPVINDSNFAIWQAYGAKAWPTLVLIDPEGNIVGSDTGEGHYEILDKLIGEMVSTYRAQNLINEKPIPLSLEKYKQGPTYLSFPGKVLADEASNRLFIADSNHNRIVITTLDGVVINIIGNGQSGRQDGAFKEAGFSRPQGLSLNGDYLYVADTENHLIRRIDLKAKVVKTIAGTGKQAEFMASGGMGISSPINSPWDLVYLDGQLYIAMAGAHQIWVMDLETTVFQPFAGSGREGCIDGLLEKSALAQPSGITASDSMLYFADSEVSAIRYVDTKENRVKTIVGQDLFVFGDVDGKGEKVRLQHPLGVANYNNLIYVADTYNHKIKIVNPVDTTSITFSGDGQAGHVDGKDAQFYEPGGLSIASNKIYVADTNNHAIRVIDMKTGGVNTLQIKGLESVALWNIPQLSTPPPFTKPFALPLKILKSDADIQVTFNINLPHGYHLNPDAPLICRIDAGEGIYFERGNQDIKIEKPVLPVRFILKSGSELKEADLKASAIFYYCRDDNQGACYMDAVEWRQPIEISKDFESTEILLDYQVKLP